MNRYVTMVSAAPAALSGTMMGKAHAQSPATRRAHELVALISSATPASIKAYVDSAFSTRMRGLPMQAKR